jgi:hypothetical protein
VSSDFGGRLAGIIYMCDISDIVPTLATIAPFADGPVRIEDVYNTRIKECDRLEACAENLRAPRHHLDDPGCVKKTSRASTMRWPAFAPPGQ